MKILHTIHSANPAGGGVIEGVMQLSRAQRGLGDEVEVISLDAANAPWLRAPDFPLHCLGQGPDAYGYTSKLIPWLREHHRAYDAVIVNGLWQFHGHAVREALRGTDTPYFVFPHGMLDPWFKRTYPWKHMKKQCYWWWRERHVLHEAVSVLFTTEEERHRAQGTFFPFHPKGAVVNLGTAAPPVADEQKQKDALYARFPQFRGRRLLLFLGRLHEKKGCDLLLRAFAKVCGASADRVGDQQRFHLVMAGPCEDPAYLGGLKSLASSLLKDPSENLTWAGMLQDDLKWGAFHVAEAFALPSHQENFGFSVVEALACGAPVLISNKVNIWREILRDEAGLVANDDLAGTTDLLERWIAQTDAERETMRACAAACFRARFDAAAAAANLRSAIETSCKERISFRTALPAGEASNSRNVPA